MVEELLHGEHSDTYNGALTIARIPSGQTFSCGLTTQRKLRLHILYLDMGHCQKQYERAKSYTAQTRVPRFQSLLCRLELSLKVLL